VILRAAAPETTTLRVHSDAPAAKRAAGCPQPRGAARQRARRKLQLRVSLRGGDAG
jgi:hypothetical protein